MASLLAVLGLLSATNPARQPCAPYPRRMPPPDLVALSLSLEAAAWYGGAEDSSGLALYAGRLEELFNRAAVPPRMRGLLRRRAGLFRSSLRPRRFCGKNPEPPAPLQSLY